MKLRSVTLLRYSFTNGHATSDDITILVIRADHADIDGLSQNIVIDIFTICSNAKS